MKVDRVLMFPFVTRKADKNGETATFGDHFEDYDEAQFRQKAQCKKDKSVKEEIEQETWQNRKNDLGQKKENDHLFFVENRGHFEVEQNSQDFFY